jgi:hypothetical protein
VDRKARGRSGFRGGRRATALGRARNLGGQPVRSCALQQICNISPFNNICGWLPTPSRKNKARAARLRLLHAQQQPQRIVKFLCS